MSTKIFRSEDGRELKVTVVGSFLAVNGERDDEEKLYGIARSCAYNVCVASTRLGVPLEHVNEHRRIWSTIWERGTEKLAVVATISGR